MNARSILLVSPRGFCAGVERAVRMAEQLLEKSAGRTVYCLKEIVHNRNVIESLKAKGMLFIQDLTDAPPGSTVLFSAHGVPPAIRNLAAQRNLKVTDATCPFVTKVHTEARRYAAQDCSILLIGHRRHDEIIGVAGEAPNHVTVVENASEARAVSVHNPERVAVLTQTTLSPDEVATVLDILRERFPALRMPATNDICYATRNRQQAVREAAPRVGAFLVLGSANSSNSNRLVEVARASGCPQAYLAGSVEELAAIPFDTVRHLGLTAGASTPDPVIRSAIEYLKTLGFETVEEYVAVREDLHFSTPENTAR